MDKKLYRSNSDRVASGVLGGIAEYMSLSSSLLRVLFVVLAIFGNALFPLVLLYVLGAVFIPLNPNTFNRYGYSGPFGDTTQPGSDIFKNEGSKKTIGISLIVLGVFFLANTVFAIDREYIIAVVLILLGIYIVFKYDKGGEH